MKISISLFRISEIRVRIFGYSHIILLCRLREIPVKVSNLTARKIERARFCAGNKNTYKNKSKFKTVSVYEVEIMNNRNISMYKSHTYHNFSNFIWKKMEEDVYIIFTKKKPKRLLSANTLTKASTVKSADLVNIVFFSFDKKNKQKIP